MENLGQNKNIVIRRIKKRQTWPSWRCLESGDGGFCAGHDGAVSGVVDYQ